MARAITQRLSIPAEANPRFADLNRKEVHGGRTIGGNHADLRFWGFTIEQGETVLHIPELVGNDFKDLTDDEAFDLAHTVLMESFASIGTECVEHN